MTQPLNDFINQVRMADSIEQERFVIATEMAQIRAYLRNCDPEMRPSIVSKLVFLDMLGENPAWGQMETITLMTSERYSYKRIGYIGASILLDETTELTVLVTHTLLKDLQNTDPNIQCIALEFIANLGSTEVCRSCATAVQKLMDSPFPSVQKRTGMAVVRIIRKNPDLCESFKNSVQSLLNQSSHGVVISGINLVITMIKNEPKLVKAWGQFAVPFTKILKSLTSARATKEFSSGVYNDPFMQIKAMQALALLHKRSDELENVLQTIVSSTETRRNTGRAILYQAVETIVAVSKKPALRGLAFNQVGRLLSLKDPNVLYSALSAFARILYNETEIINRGSADSMALQRYKKRIVACLDHQDPSIRRRALDVISALIDENNAETLIPEILQYAKLADSEFRPELVSKIYAATQRFAPSAEWNFDTVHQILIDSGNYVSADIISSFCELITRTPALQAHAVQKLSDSLLHFADNQALMQVSAFVVGEFALDDNGATEAFCQILVLPQTTVETQLYIITAISKLAVRVGGTRSMTLEALANAAKSNNLEVQQRAGEMLKLLQMPGVGEELLAPIAAIGTADVDEKAITIKHDANEDEDDLLLLVMDDAPHKSSPQSADPLDLLGLEPSKPQQPAKAPASTDPLDLLGLSSVSKPAAPSQNIQQPSTLPQNAPAQPIQPQPVQAQPQPQPMPLPPGAFQMLKLDSLTLYGQTQKNPQDPRQVALNVIAVGTSHRDLTNFVMEFAPANGWKMQARPANGNVLGGGGSRHVCRVLYLLNEAGTPFGMQAKISYVFGTLPQTETGVIRNLQ